MTAPFDPAPLRARLETVDKVIDAVMQDVSELPDRTSPDDWPEAMLVTADELRASLAQHLSGLRADLDACRQREQEMVQERDHWQHAASAYATSWRNADSALAAREADRRKLKAVMAVMEADAEPRRYASLYHKIRTALAD